MRGGASVFVENQGELAPNSKHLDIGEKSIKHLKNSDQIDQKVFDLKLQTEKLKDSLVLNNQLGTEESQEKVLNIFSESKKEVEVQKINTQAHAKVDTTRKRINYQDRQKFTLALEKIKKFNKNKFEPSSRSQSVSSQIQKLSIQEKKAISDLFEKFESLDREKVGFSNKLVQLSDNGKFSTLVQNVCMSCIPQDLQKIGWNSPDLNIFERSSSLSSHPTLPYIYYQSKRALPSSAAQSTWGDWNAKSHPYHEFFSSESEWLNYVNKISDSWKSYNSYMNSAGRITTTVFTFGMLGSQDKGKLERKINDSKASLELSIGARMMDLMKQLN